MTKKFSKEDIDSVIKQLRMELNGSNETKYIDPWFQHKSINPPVYKKLVFGARTNDDGCELIIKTFTKNGKTNRLAHSILSNAGVPGDVEINFSGRLRHSLLFNPSSQKTSGMHPLQPSDHLFVGSSISTRFGPGGTLGLFVRTENQEIGILSCGHIFSELKKDNAKVYSPSTSLLRSGKEIGDLSLLNRPKKKTSNKIDASVTLIEQSLVSLASNEIKHKIEFLGRQIERPFNNFSFENGESVYKIGSKVIFKKGSLEGEYYDVDIKGYVFDRCIVVNETSAPFCLPGDSGSVGFIEKNDKLYAIGIVVGRGIRWIGPKRNNYQTQVYLCPLDTIIDEYKLSLI